MVDVRCHPPLERRRFGTTTDASFVSSGASARLDDDREAPPRRKSTKPPETENASIDRSSPSPRRARCVSARARPPGRSGRSPRFFSADARRDGGRRRRYPRHGELRRPHHGPGVRDPGPSGLQPRRPGGGEGGVPQALPEVAPRQEPPREAGGGEAQVHAGHRCVSYRHHQQLRLQTMGGELYNPADADARRRAQDGARGEGPVRDRGCAESEGGLPAERKVRGGRERSVVRRHEARSVVRRPDGVGVLADDEDRKRRFRKRRFIGRFGLCHESASRNRLRSPLGKCRRRGVRGRGDPNGRLESAPGGRGRGSETAKRASGSRPRRVIRRRVDESRRDAERRRA